MDAFVILGGTGGTVAALTAVIVIGRGIFKQVAATEDNTAALNGLTAKVESIASTVRSNETRLAVLEDRGKRETGH